jgi:DNA-binding response OmpR family regulator
MKVLVAEDDRRMREGIVELLESDGYIAIGARDGDEVLSLFDTEQPDFVVLDIMMPRRSGYDACREIRRRDSAVPVMFLSAKSEEIDKVVGLELGADDYMSKPFGAKELLARLRAIARRRYVPGGGGQPERFEMAELTVRPAELRAQRAGVSIDLSPRDVRILRALYTRRGTVIGRDELFEMCWDGSYYPSSRALDQHICQLRKKIEPDPKSPTIIKTVHGAGYRYDE